MRTKLLVALFMALPSISAASINNNRSLKKIYDEIEDFSKKCSFIAHGKILVEMSGVNLSQKSLAGILKNRISSFYTEFTDYGDDELFGQGTYVGLDARDFSGTFLRDSECLGLMSNLNNRFEITGALATSPTGDKALGHIFQTKVEGETYQIIFLSRLKAAPKYAIQSEFFYEDLNLVEEKSVVLTDSQLVYLSRGINLPTVPARIETLFVEARNALIDYDSVYGAAVYNGDYIRNTATTWFYSKGINPKNGEELEVIYFSEFDDGSYSLYFNPHTNDLIYITYEN